MPVTNAFAAVPNLMISHRSAACFRAGIAVEAVLGSITDLDELDRVLATSETALGFVVQDAPLWSEGHRAIARNLWFQGRFPEALQHFAAGERCLPRMAERAGWDPQECVMLPRNCVHVIGLMGHIDAFVKHKMLSNDARPYYLLAPKNEIVNRAFLDYWARYVTVVTDPAEIDRLARLEPAYSVNWNWIMPSGEDDVVDVHTGMARVQRRWQEERRAPLLRLEDAHVRLLANQKAAWGMKEDDWFVCLHVRSAGFYTEKAGTAQDFRNTPISDYYPLIRSIVDAGGWVMRMGDPSAPPLDFDKCGAHPNMVIDYAHRSERSAELDVALSASCRLFVSSSSGLHAVAHSFGRPVCLVNLPVYAGFPGDPGDIFIPQFYFSRRLQRNLTLREFLSSDLVYANHNFHLQRAGIELRRNKPSDIVEAVREALNPDSYAEAGGVRAVRVRQIFDRLNRDYGVNISGRLGAHFAATYGDVLAPDSECTLAATSNSNQS